MCCGDENKYVLCNCIYACRTECSFCLSFYLPARIHVFQSFAALDGGGSAQRGVWSLGFADVGMGKKIK